MTISDKEHLQKSYDEELNQLRRRILEMGAIAEEQVSSAISAVSDGRENLASRVLSNEPRVDNLQIQIDDLCATLIAKRQPVGMDMRLILSTVRMSTDLERVGDEAEKIAKMYMKISDENVPFPRDLIQDIQFMGELARAELHDALDAVGRMDVEKAVQVTIGDKKLDIAFRSQIRRLATYMMEDPRLIGVAAETLLIAKALERIGDHAKNISQEVVYMVEGKDVRHVKGAEITKTIQENS